MRLLPVTRMSPRQKCDECPNYAVIFSSTSSLCKKCFEEEGIKLLQNKSS